MKQDENEEQEPELEQSRGRRKSSTSSMSGGGRNEGEKKNKKQEKRALADTERVRKLEDRHGRPGLDRTGQGKTRTDVTDLTTTCARQNDDM